MGLFLIDGGGGVFEAVLKGPSPLTVSSGGGFVVNQRSRYVHSPLQADAAVVKGFIQVNGDMGRWVSSEYTKWTDKKSKTNPRRWRREGKITKIVKHSGVFPSPDEPVDARTRFRRQKKCQTAKAMVKTVKCFLSVSPVAVGYASSWSMLVVSVKLGRQCHGAWTTSKSRSVHRGLIKSAFISMLSVISRFLCSFLSWSIASHASLEAGKLVITLKACFESDVQINRCP